MVRSPIPLSHGNRMTNESPITAHDGQLHAATISPWLLGRERCCVRCTTCSKTNADRPHIDSARGRTDLGPIAGARLAHGVTLDETPTAQVSGKPNVALSRNGVGVESRLISPDSPKVSAKSR